MNLSNDDAIIATNDDASSCKYQAVKKGYYKDPFIELLLPQKIANLSTKRAPEINRGYYARSASIAFIVEQFIKEYPGSQIISFGSGYDSLFWRLRALSLPQFKFTEIDFDIVVLRKISAIKKHMTLSNELSNIEYKNNSLISKQYNLVSQDLRRLSTFGNKLFQDCGLDPSIPTLCFSECVLVYMTLEESSSLLRWLTGAFSNLTYINYEQCNMLDKFGEIMMSNLMARNCELLGVEVCRSLSSQKERFKSAGFPFVDAWTLVHVYDNLILPADRERIEKLEFLDEKEILLQLLYHYCIVVASTGELPKFLFDIYWSSKSCN